MSATAIIVSIVGALVAIGLLAWLGRDKSSDDDRDNWFW